MTKDETKQNVIRRVVISTAAVAGGVAILVLGFNQLRYRAQLRQEQSRQEWRQKSLDAIKSGNSNAWVMDSKLLPILANDPDCQRIVKHLDFTSTEIDADDAKAVAMLRRVTSMSFYCTTGTEHVLHAAKALPITDLYFEMPDLTEESYFILKEFPELETVRFEHVMPPKLVDRLQSELPQVKLDAPFTD